MKQLSTNICLTLLITFSVILASNNVYSQNKAAIKAAEYAERMQFADAKDSWIKAIKKEPSNSSYYEQLGLVSKKLNFYAEAEKAFYTADSLNGLSDAGRITYSQTLLHNGKPQESNEQVRIYLAKNPENFLIRQMLQSLDKLTIWREEPNAFVIYPMSGLNTFHSEFSPFVYDDKLMFTSARNEDLVNSNENSFSNEGYHTIFSAILEGDDLRSNKKAKPFSTKWTGDFHVGPVSVDTVNSIIYYSKIKSSLSKKKVHYMKAYQAELVKGKKVKKERELSFNSDSSSTGHVAVSPNGKVLCFSSDRAGTMDLYITYELNGSWSDPKAISELNTDLNELFPYLKNDSTLLFSSNGHPGYGGLDIFQSEYVDGSWTKPTNLKAPINSSKDDFSICYLNDSKGYFASNRDGGKGLDDIYQFIQLAAPSNNARTEIAGVFEYQGLPTQGVTLTLLDEDDNEIMVVQTDSNGKFDFGALPSNDNYKIKIEDQADEFIADSKIYLINDLGEKIIILGKEAGSLFSFRTLPQEEQDQLTLIEEDDAEMEDYDMFGQIFSKLDRDDFSTLSLDVFDEDGNFIKKVFLDENGYYEIRNLMKGKYYKLSLSEDGDFSTTVFIDDGYSVKQFLAENSLFSFSKLEVIPSDQFELSVTGSLLINNNGKASINTRIRFFNQENLNIGGAISDEEGYFKIENLDQKTSYLLYLADSLDTVSSNLIEIFVLDINKNRVAKAKKIAPSIYEFTTLSQSAYAGADSSPSDEFDVNGQLFYKLPGDLNKELEIFATDKDGNLIEKAAVDSNGFFKFTRLQADASYTFSLSEEADSEMSVYFYDEQQKVQDSILFSSLSVYVYEKLQIEKANSLSSFNSDEENSELNNEVVNGQIYKTLPGDYKEGIKVYAVGDDGKVIDSTYTDQGGNFKFSRLSPDESFTLSVADEDDVDLNISFGVLGQKDGSNFGLVNGQIYKTLPGDYKEGIKVYAVDDNGNVIDSAYTDAGGNFLFSKLSPDDSFTLSVVDEEDTDLNIKYGTGGKLEDFNADLVNGQIYKTLPGDYKLGIKVYALDDSGNVIDSTYTDNKGNFKFSKLSRDETFTLSVVDEVDTDLNIAFVNFDGHFEGAAKTDSSNQFVYSKIIIEAAADLSYEEIEKIVYEPLFGQLFKQVPGDYPSGTKIYAYDNDGNVIDVATLDDMGNFTFTKLQRDENYLFRTDDENDEFIINVLDSDGELVDRINVVERTWAYTQLKRQDNKITPLEAEDDSGLNLDPYETSEKALISSDRQTIYYNYKTFKLSEDDIEVLKQYVSELKADTNLVIEINSHTDQTEQTSQRSYSALRSVSIANYLHNNGVPLNQLIITNWEDDKMLIECSDEKPCSDEDRLRNMRSHLSLVNRAALPPAPDYVIYFDFDKWKLSQDGNKEMFQVIKNVQAENEVEIILDGYTDVWGGYEMNDRISQLRVLNIQNLLIEKGQNRTQIQSIVHGESRPMGGCKLQYPCPLNEREQNRRVEIRIKEKVQ